MSNHYSCWSYAYDQARFIETNLAIFGKNESNFRERNAFQ